ncbi:MAG TPA: RDD family protein [Methylomirabilota bacterium]|nr:RDD family protein [Methylomirabilota bacterium]
MRCPTCGYVSFDHLEACKECGADLQKGKRRDSIPAFTAAPVGSGPGEPSQKPDVRAQEIDALFAGLSASPGPAPASAQEAQECTPFHLQLDTLSPLPPSRGGVASLAEVQTDTSGPVRVDTLPRAGFWIRLAAWIADIVCLFLATIVLAVLVLATIWFGGRLGGEINEQVMALAGYSGAVIVMASGFLYFTLFVGSSGQTPGKMLFRLKVVRVNDQEMTYGRAVLRSLCWILSLLLFSIGFLMIAFNRQKQGLHDVLAGTYVIRTQRWL